MNTIKSSDTVLLSHGSGRGLQELLSTIVLPALLQNKDAVLEDAAVINTQAGRLAFTTDSFVIHPLQFPGGDIGKLAACGTINDLAMMGAKPSHLSVSLIIEEGFNIALLKSLLVSLKKTCDDCNVTIACGDTKVVDHGKADGLFINTSGIGTILPNITLSAANATEGDAVIVSGPIGEHGVAVLAARHNLSLNSSVVSDCAPLDTLAHALLAASPGTRCMRDATRGGAAAVLNEIAAASNVTIRLKSADVPVSQGVKSACAFLGMDPLQIACEGRFVALVPADQLEAGLSAIRQLPNGEQATCIGKVEKRGRFGVIADTEIGGTRVIEVPAGELLPRIC